MIAGRTADATRPRRGAASSTGRAAASASPTPTTSPWCATSSPSWSLRDCVPRGPGTGGLSSDPGPSHRHAVAPTPILLPRPRSFDAAPDGRRVPDREPDETIDAGARAAGIPPRGRRRRGARGRRRRRRAAPRPRHAGPAAPPRQRAGRRRRRHRCRRVGSRTGPTSPCAASCSTCRATACPPCETLVALVDRLASWKINQLQLYMEHTFAYAGHEDVWRHADPYTAEDIQALDAHCRSRGVELVANQNTLGHFERWLRLRPLPAPGHRPRRLRLDVRDPPSRPDPRPGQSRGVRARVGPPRPARPRRLPSTRVHIGLDEPWELSPERQRRMGAVAARPAAASGPGRTRAARVGRRPRRCTPSCWPSFPRASRCASGDTRATIPSSSAPRDSRTPGVPFWVCPGTSSWMSISGRVDNMIENIGAAAAAGVAHGAAGLLVTDWGDMGHHQQPCVSDPGFATAAAFGWCVEAHAGLDADDLAAVLDVHCYDDPAGRTGQRRRGPRARPTAWSRRGPPTCRPWRCPSSSPSGRWAERSPTASPRPTSTP